MGLAGIEVFFQYVMALKHHSGVCLNFIESVSKVE